AYFSMKAFIGIFIILFTLFIFPFNELELDARVGGGRSYRGSSRRSYSSRPSRSPSRSYSSSRSRSSSPSRSYSSRSRPRTRSYSSRPRPRSGGIIYRSGSRRRPTSGTRVVYEDEEGGYFWLEFLLAFVIFVLIIAIVMVVVLKTPQDEPDDEFWECGDDTDHAQWQKDEYFARISEKRKRYRAVKKQIEKFKQLDKNFSIPLFRDFVGLIFTRLHTLKVSDIEPLRPYFEDSYFEKLKSEMKNPEVQEISEVIIGQLGIENLQMAKGFVQCSVDIEGNFTEIRADGEHGFFIQQVFTFRKPIDVLSKEPGIMTSLGCPNCGNTSMDSYRGNCDACGEPLKSGLHNWEITGINTVEQSPKDKYGHTPPKEEFGEFFPTVKQVELGANLRELVSRDNEFSPSMFQNFAGETFMEMQKAWTEKNWQVFRKFETDALYHSHKYWMDIYEKKGITNNIENINVIGVEVAKVETDAFFDAVTVRIRASMTDVDVDSNGKIISGQENPVKFSEYWTFIRSTQFKKPKSEDSSCCPSCSAPLEVNQSGDCEYCGSRVSTGDFNWVLSNIAQDEAYAG
ncbi:TIM44-like domain-containing protein, partial [Candidatus Riflebacteria bacterium]